jgi:signal transduction histidine kinase
LAVALGILLLSLLHQLRIQHISSLMKARFDERLAERTRIARDFHDTLLQTIQASKLVADGTLDASTGQDRANEILRKLSGWLGQAIEEGRSALHSLRISTVEGNDLAEGFRRACDEYAAPRQIEFSISLEGGAEEMHPIVRDEVYQIGCEAIRNACMHSGATRVIVDLAYRGDLRLRVRDNGTGIDSSVAIKGRPGHFGLAGMQERSSRIKARLNISSAPDTGTEVNLVVPRNIVFPPPTAEHRPSRDFTWHWASAYSSLRWRFRRLLHFFSRR